MRHISKLKRQRFLPREGLNYLMQLWFHYHFVFFRFLLFRGLKLKAFNFLVLVKEGLKRREAFDPSFLFFLSLLNITPSLFLKSFKMGGLSYDIPLPLTYWKKIALGCRWVIKLLKMRYRIFTVSRIVDSLAGSFGSEGLSLNKKWQVYFTALANRHLLKNKIFNK